MKNYRKGNYYSYEPTKIQNYVNFYYQATEILLSKVERRFLELSSDEIASQPSRAIKKVGDFLSTDFEIDRIEPAKPKEKNNENFYSYFRGLEERHIKV